MTVKQLSKLLTDALSPFDAQAILETLLGYDHAQMILNADRELPSSAVTQAMEMKKRREQGEPIQYIIGKWSFLGREYTVGDGALIPRDDTEVLVRESLRLIPTKQAARVLDLCAGTGIIAITIKEERPLSEVFAVEKSEKAFAYLTQNVRSNNADVMCILSDLKDCIDRFSNGSLDMIISNPPYIKSSDLPALQREVQYEPPLALDGGASGYDFYECIIPLYKGKIRKGGVIAFEIGEGQSEYIAALLRDEGFEDIRLYDDIQSIPRAVTARKSN